MCTKQLRETTTKVFISLLQCYAENTEVKAGKGKKGSKDTNQLEEEHYDSLFWLVLHQKWQKKKKKSWWQCFQSLMSYSAYPWHALVKGGEMFKDNKNVINTTN